MSAAGVLYVANSSIIGGANRVLMDLIGGLDPARYAPILVAPSAGPLVDWAGHSGVACRIVADGDLRGRSGLWRRGLHLAAIARATRAGFVHAIDPTCYRAAGLAGTIAGLTRICHVEYPPEIGNLPWLFQFGPDAVITCHSGQVTDIRAGLPRGLRPRVVSIPNAVDTTQFAVAPPPSAEAPERFGAKHVVLIVGHLSETKGHPTFLRAAAQIQAALGDCAFVCLGGETVCHGFRSTLEQLARDLGIADRVHFLGWRPKESVRACLNAADVIALPSIAEGLPLAILEAMACGKPVVATPVGGVPDAITDGDTGVLVPPEHPEALAAALIGVLRDPATAARMGLRGRQRVESRFSLRTFLSSVEAVYDGFRRAA